MFCMQAKTFRSPMKEELINSSAFKLPSQLHGHLVYIKWRIFLHLFCLGVIRVSIKHRWAMPASAGFQLLVHKHQRWLGLPRSAINRRILFSSRSFNIIDPVAVLTASWPHFVPESVAPTFLIPSGICPHSASRNLLLSSGGTLL